MTVQQAPAPAAKAAPAALAKSGERRAARRRSPVSGGVEAQRRAKAPDHSAAIGGSENPELAAAQQAIQTVRAHTGPIERFKDLLDGKVTDGDAVEALEILSTMMPQHRETILRSLPPELVPLLLDQLPDDESHPFRVRSPGAFISLSVFGGVVTPLHWYLRRTPEQVGVGPLMHHEAALLLDALPEADLATYAASGPFVAAWKAVVEFSGKTSHKSTLKRVSRACKSSQRAAATAKASAEHLAAAKVGAKARVAKDKDLTQAADTVEELLSYETFDWTITDAEARKALNLLASIGSDGDRQAVILTLEQRGLDLDRLADNLSEEDRVANLAAFLSVMSQRDPQRNVSFLEGLLSGDVLGDMSESDARLVMQMMHALPKAEQLRLRTLHDGEWWAEMTSELSEEAVQDETTGFAGQSEDKDALKALFASQASTWSAARVQSVARMLRAMGEGAFVDRAAGEAGVTVAEERTLEAEEAHTLVGSGLSLVNDGALTASSGTLEMADVLGVIGLGEEFQLAKLGGELGETANKLHFQKHEDRLVAKIPVLILAGVHRLSGTTKLDTGPLVAKNITIDLKWPSDGTSKDAPKAWFKLIIGGLLTDHIMQTTPEGALNLGRFSMERFELKASQRPSVERPDGMGDGLKYAMTVLQDLMPGFAHLVEAASRASSKPEEVGNALGEAFPKMTHADITLGKLSIAGVDTSGGAHVDGVELSGMAVMVRSRFKDEVLSQQLHGLRERLASPTLAPMQRRATQRQFAMLHRQWKSARTMRHRFNRLDSLSSEKVTEEERVERDELRKALMVNTTRAALQDLTLKGVQQGDTFVAEASVKRLRARATTSQGADGKSRIDAVLSADVSASGILRGGNKTRFDQRLVSYQALLRKERKSAADEVTLEDLERDFRPVMDDWREREQLKDRASLNEADTARLKALDEKLAVWSEQCPDLLVGHMQAQLRASLSDGVASASLEGIEATGFQKGELTMNRLGVARISASAQGEGLGLADIGRADAQMTGLHVEGLEKGVKGERGYMAAKSADLKSLTGSYDSSDHGGIAQVRIKGLTLKEVASDAASMADKLDFKVRVLGKQVERLKSSLDEKDSEPSERLEKQQEALALTERRFKRAARQQRRYVKLKGRATKAKTRQGRRWWRKKLAKWNALTQTTLAEIGAEDVTLSFINTGSLDEFDPNFVGVKSEGRIGAKGVKRNGLSAEEVYANGLNGGITLDGSGQYSLSAAEMGGRKIRDKGKYRIKNVVAKGVTVAGANEGPTVAEAKKLRGVGYVADGNAAGGFGATNVKGQLADNGALSGTAQSAWVHNALVRSRTKANKKKKRARSTATTRIRDGAASAAHFNLGPNSNSFGAKRTRASGVDVKTTKDGKPSVDVGADTADIADLNVSMGKFGKRRLHASMGKSTLGGVVGSAPGAEAFGLSSNFVGDEVNFNKLVYDAYHGKKDPKPGSHRGTPRKPGEKPEPGEGVGDHSALEVSGAEVKGGLAYGAFGQAGADALGARHIRMEQDKVDGQEGGYRDIDVKGGYIRDGHGTIKDGGRTIHAHTHKTDISRAHVGTGPKGQMDVDADVVTDAYIQVDEQDGEKRRLMPQGDVTAQGLWYRQAEGIRGGGVKSLRGQVDYQGDSPFVLPNGEQVMGGGANLDINDLQVTQKHGRKTEITYGVIRASKVYLTKLARGGTKKQAILKVLELGKKGQISDAVINKDGSIDGDLFGVTLETEKGVELPISMLGMAITGKLQVGTIKVRRLKPGDLGSAGSSLVLDDVRLKGSVVVGDNKAYLDEFQIGELAARGQGDGKVEVVFDWLRAKGRVDGWGAKGKGSTTLRDVGALLKVGSSPDILSGWLGSMKNDVELEVTLGPGDPKKQFAQRPKLFLEALRNADGSLYLSQLNEMEATIPLKGGVLQVSEAKGWHSGFGIPARIGPIGKFIDREIMAPAKGTKPLTRDRDLRSELRDEGEASPLRRVAKERESAEGMRSLHASLVVDKMHGHLGYAQGALSVGGHLDGFDSLRAGKRVGEGATAEAENLSVTNVHIETLRRLITVGKTHLPSISIKMSGPDSAKTKVTVHIDNNTIKDVRVQTPPKQEGAP